MANTFKFKNLETTDNFTLYSLNNRSKSVSFNLSGITTGQKRIITLPDKNITLDHSGDARIPLAHSNSHNKGESDEISPSGIGAPSIMQSIAMGFILN